VPGYEGKGWREEGRWIFEKAVVGRSSSWFSRTTPLFGQRVVVDSAQKKYYRSCYKNKHTVKKDGRNNMQKSRCLSFTGKIGDRKSKKHLMQAQQNLIFLCLHETEFYASISVFPAKPSSAKNRPSP
jgi:hypothetical protein